MGIISPIFGVKIKNIWNHHLENMWEIWSNMDNEFSEKKKHEVLFYKNHDNKDGVTMNLRFKILMSEQVPDRCRDCNFNH